MYDDLIKKLRHCGNAISCLHCPYWEGGGGSKEDLTQAANAIEELAMKLHGDEAAIAGMKREIERMVIDTANSKPRWIPVTERLPEDEEAVFVVRKFLGVKGQVPPSTYTEVAYRIDDRWVADSDEYKIARHRHTDPLFWMPLPEPPKEET